jgi:phosphatidate cytidylyltransferase
LLVTRVLTAAVLLAGFLAAILLLGRAQFGIVVTLAIGAAAWEWARLCRFGRSSAALYAVGGAAAFAALAAALWPIDAGEIPEIAIFGAAAVFWIVAAPLWLGRGLERADAALRPWVLPATAWLVLIPTGLAMLAVPGLHLLAILALIWIADTAAYAAGRAFGRRKLAPHISPGKTWEGVAGGMLGCAAYAAALAAYTPQLAALTGGVRWVPYIGAALLLCALSVVGDLFESALKRRAGVKDSGSLLPGHGGVLDRIDSTTSALPVAVLLLHWAGVK